jgi:hypothetical protein
MQREPERLFRKRKVAEDGGTLVVRIHSHRAQFPNLIPTPYQVYRFDPASCALTLLSTEEALPFTIPKGLRRRRRHIQVHQLGEQGARCCTFEKL